MIWQMINFKKLFPKWYQLLSKKKHHTLPQHIHKLANLEIDQIKNCGIQGIILDLDNTIISEDDCYLSPGAEDWIIQAKLAGLKFFILSNGKRNYRVRFWSNRLNIPAINPARKPCLSAFCKAISYLKLPPKKVVVIGDSLHTDILGGWLCGCRCIQVNSLPHPPQWWEKLVGKWVQIPYPDRGELWNFDAPLSYENFL